VRVVCRPQDSQKPRRWPLPRQYPWQRRRGLAIQALIGRASRRSRCGRGFGSPCLASGSLAG
jgi:hypothetical protein